MQQIQKGQTTSVFARTIQIAPVNENICLSIIVEARSMDIQCANEAERDEIVYCLTNLLDGK